MTDDEQIVGGEDAMEDTDALTGHRKVTFRARDINTHLVCRICSGYFRDAHTIVECLHTFCKSCILKAFREAQYGACPHCHINLGPNPRSQIMFDRTLQELVDRTFPHLSKQDRVEEEEFYRQRGLQLKPEFAKLKRTTRSSEPAKKKTKTKPTGSAFQNHLSYHMLPEDCSHANNILKKSSTASNSSSSSSSSSGTGAGATTAGNEATDGNGAGSEGGEAKTKEGEGEDDSSKANKKEKDKEQTQQQLPPLKKPFLRSSDKLKVAQLKKYLVSKLGLNDVSEVEIMCNNELMGPDLSLNFIARTRWVAASSDLVLTYRRAIYS